MKIPFEASDQERFFMHIREIFKSNFWSDGQMTIQFEMAFAEYSRLPARAVNSGGAGLLAILDYLNVQGQEVIVPANTFWATALAVKKAGGIPVYADCNREDLCLSLEDIKKKVRSKTKAVILVHIGGHIAFQSEEISHFCKTNDIFLIEDCAHTHGAWWNAKTGGHYGFAGAYSFYATKTMPLGEGGMIVSRDDDFLHWVEEYRNYGKRVNNGRVTYPVKNGFNFRMNEFAAALGLIQMDRLPAILEWKQKLAAKFDLIFSNRVKFPTGMSSGYYKYIVFGYDGLRGETGQVFGPDDLGPVIEGIKTDMPNTQWVSRNHKCLPIYYGWEGAEKDIAELRSDLL